MSNVITLAGRPPKAGSRADKIKQILRGLIGDDLHYVEVHLLVSRQVPDLTDDELNKAMFAVIEERKQ